MDNGSKRNLPWKALIEAKYRHGEALARLEELRSVAGSTWQIMVHGQENVVKAEAEKVEGLQRCCMQHRKELVTACFDGRHDLLVFCVLATAFSSEQVYRTFMRWHGGYSEPVERRWWADEFYYEHDQSKEVSDEEE